MVEPPRSIIFEGRKYRLSGNYYRRHRWSGPGPSNLHRAIWESANGAIPENCEVHHRDGNTFNNDLSNLECLPVSQHQRDHTSARHRAGLLQPWGDKSRKRAAEWHRSEAGHLWHKQHGKDGWKHRKWVEVTCQQCGIAFCTPYPKRAKFCHQNCKANALRTRRGKPVGVRSYRRKPRVLSGKRNPGQQ